VHTVRANGDGDVDSIVDNDGDANGLNQRPAEPGQFRRGGPLEAELDGSDAPLLRRLDDGDKITAPEECVVRDEHEAQCLR
jgi:hypothetical protein